MKILPEVKNISSISYRYFYDTSHIRDILIHGKKFTMSIVKTYPVFSLVSYISITRTYNFSIY